MNTLPEQFCQDWTDALESLATAELRALATTAQKMDGCSAALRQYFNVCAAAAGWVERDRARAMQPFERDLLEGRITEAGWGHPEAFGGS